MKCSVQSLLEFQVLGAPLLRPNLCKGLRPGYQEMQKQKAQAKSYGFHFSPYRWHCDVPLCAIFPSPPQTVQRLLHMEPDWFSCNLLKGRGRTWQKSCQFHVHCRYAWIIMNQNVRACILCATARETTRGRQLCGLQAFSDCCVPPLSLLDNKSLPKCGYCTFISHARICIDELLEQVVKLDYYFFETFPVML